MNQDEKQRILTTIERLTSGQSEISAFEAEKLLMSVLVPLLKEDGFEIQEQVPFGAPNNGIDCTGIKPYVKAKSGLWSPPERLAKVLYQSTQ